MPIEIKIGPPQITIHSDRNAFVSAPDGGVDPSPMAVCSFATRGSLQSGD